MLLAGKLNVKMIDAARTSDQGSICSAMEVDFIFASGKAANSAKNSWIFKYTNPAGEEKRLGLGVYPDVGLAQAREAALGMRQLVSAGKDPKDDKAKRRIAARKRSLDTFAKVARQWHRHAAVVCHGSEGHSHKRLRMLEIHAFPKIGRIPIGLLTPPVIIELLTSVAISTKEFAP